MSKVNNVIDEADDKVVDMKDKDIIVIHSANTRKLTVSIVFDKAMCMYFLMDNKSGERVTDFYDEIKYNFVGYFSVRSGKKWNFMKRKGLEIVSTEWFDDVQEVDRDMYKVRIGDKWMIFMPSWKVYATSEKFDDIQPIGNREYLVTVDGKQKIVNEYGGFKRCPSDISLKDSSEYNN